MVRIVKSVWQQYALDAAKRRAYEKPFNKPAEAADAK